MLCRSALVQAKNKVNSAAAECSLASTKPEERMQSLFKLEEK